MKLILVYNADNGVFNALYDTAHKIFSPHTYQCSLCKYTYSLQGMVLPWKKFLETVPAQKVFLHRNEFREQYPDQAISYPAILWEEEGAQQVLLSAAEINACDNLETLMNSLKAKLVAIAPSISLLPDGYVSE